MASALVVCSGIGLEIYNQLTASWIRFLNDSMATCSFLAMMLVFFGLASGFLFGRAPKFFGLMVALTLLSYFSLALWSRLAPADLGPPALNETK